MPTISVDGRDYEVRAGGNLLHACLSLGFDIPYFCWHPAMGSVGACRQCAISQFKDENDTRGTIAMACMTPVKDGARISIEDEQVRRFRAGVIEFLMANHPHDLLDAVQRAQFLSRDGQRVEDGRSSGVPSLVRRQLSTQLSCEGHFPVVKRKHAA